MADNEDARSYRYDDSQMDGGDDNEEDGDFMSQQSRQVSGFQTPLHVNSEISQMSSVHKAFAPGGNNMMNKFSFGKASSTVDHHQFSEAASTSKPQQAAYSNTQLNASGGKSARGESMLRESQPPHGAASEAAEPVPHLGNGPVDHMSLMTNILKGSNTANKHYKQRGALTGLTTP